MKAAKKRKLEASGWKVSSVADVLSLSEEEEAYIELKLSLAEGLKELRTKEKITQAELAKKIHSSQPRVAKMEAGDASVSVDLLIKSIFALGATRKDLAKFIS